MRCDDLPCIGRAVLWLLLLGCSARRLQYFLGAYLGLIPSDPSGELRLTVEYFAGLLLESVLFVIPALAPFRGALFTMAIFVTIADGSVFYNPMKLAWMPL